jgi:hypothetical protein
MLPTSKQKMLLLVPNYVKRILLRLIRSKAEDVIALSGNEAPF